MKLIKLTIAICLSGVFLLNAQSLEVLSTEITQFPLIKSKIFVYDKDVYPVQNLQKNQILINDKGLVSDVEEYLCVDPALLDSLRIVIAFDNALNTDTINGFSNFDIGKSMLDNIISNAEMSHSKILLTSYDYQNYLMADMTDETDSLLINSNKFFKKKSSYIYPGIDYSPLGAQNITDYYNDVNTAIIITDGNQKSGIDSTISKFKEKGIKVFPLIINNRIPSKLAQIANETNGYYFNGIDKNTNRRSIARIILSMARGYEPCEISWISEISCNDTSDIRISVPSINAAKNFHYIFEAEEKPAIQSDPLDLGFSSVIPGTAKELDITIIAKNSDVFISDLYLLDDRFEIISGHNTDFILEKDEFKNLRIRYTPTNTGTRADSAIVFTKLIIESDACSGNEIFVTGGFPNTPPVTKTIEVINPSCGETLLVGDTINVEWVGLLRRDVVQIEYSTDNGATWKPLAMNTTGLDYEWIVPDEVSEECLIRVIQMWPNNVGKTLDLHHNDNVHSGFFNGDGSKVITASSDMTAVIWNGNNGAKEHTLSRHNHQVKYAVFNPDENYVATASRDSTAMLWDVNSGEHIRTFEGHRGSVNSVNFSHNGNYIVTAGNDGNVVIWDTESGEVVKEFSVYPGATGRAWFASFSPDDNFILTAGNDGIANMIDIETGEYTKIFDSRNYAGKGNAIHAIFNYNATKVALTSSYDPKRVMVWDIDGEMNYTIDDTLYTISHNPDSTTNSVINSTSFYYDGLREYILTSGSDNIAKKWSATTGEPSDPHIFKEHTGIVETAVFNFDARRVLTTSWDNTAKIWNLDQRDLQMDTTDCNFAIAYADAEAIDIALGDVPYGYSLDIPVFPIKNSANFTYRVSSAKIINDASQSFMFINENPYPFMLDSLDSHMFEIRYEGKELGENTSVIEFVIPGKTITANITANTVIKNITEYTNLVDFGKVDLGELKDTTFSVILSNTSGSEIIIDSVYLAGYSSKEFNYFDLEEIPIALSPGDNLPVKLRFSPQTLGLKNARLIFNHNGRFSPAEINLFGISDILMKDTVYISIDDAEGQPGDIIDVAVRIRVSQDRPLPETIEGFNAELCFNSTLLEPVGNFTKNTIVNDYLRCIEFDTDVNDMKGDIIKTLQFRVGLGNDSLSPLSLKYSYPLGKGSVTLIEEDGLFTLTGFCNNDDPRLFDPYGNLALAQNMPNPANSSTTIEFEVLEADNIRLDITDILGKLNKTIINEFLLPGKYQVSVDVNKLPSGTYIYTLKTSTGIINRRMEIRK